MFWKSQGGGPWGSGPRGGGPWGGNRGSGGGSGPRGRGPQPPDFEELLRRGQDRFRRVLPGGFGTGTGISVVVLGILVIWLASGFYRVLPDEVGVVLRFGAYNRTTQPGLNYHLPTPIETVLTPSVTRVNRTEIGYRNAEGPGRGQVTRQVPEEALMLTGDENIVDINFTVFWVIKNAQAYLFNIRDPDATVKSAAESAMREIVGETPIAQALSEGRGKIETDTQRLLQSILDTYGAGIELTQLQLLKVDPPAPVIDAFRDVQRALADRERLRNEAEVLPQRHRPAGARRCRANHPGGRSLSPGDHRPFPGRRRSFPLRVPRLRRGAGCHAAAALSRDDGGDPQEQQQGDHRQIGPRREWRPALFAAASPRRRPRGRRCRACREQRYGARWNTAAGTRRPIVAALARKVS